MQIQRNAIASLSQTIRNRIAVVTTQARERHEQQQNAAAARERLRLAQNEREATILAGRVALARQGLERLLEFGACEDVQELIGLLSEVNQTCVFYCAERYWGDAWYFWCERDFERLEALGGVCTTTIGLYSDRLFVSCVTDVPGSRPRALTWEIFYRPEAQLQAAWKGGHEGRVESGVSIDTFLAEISTLEPISLALVGRDNQRTLEWETEEVVFELLVSCASRQNFASHVQRCIANTSSTL